MRDVALRKRSESEVSSFNKPKTMLAAETRNHWRKYQRSENEEQLHAHCIFFKFCAKFFRPNEVLGVPVAWEELPFGKCEVVPGQVDQSTTND